MEKRVYSIVLMDDVIKAVDKQAYLLGTSRSNLINQILAEHLSCITPEMRMRSIFDTVSELISGNMTVQQQGSASLLTLRTALEYKYRPTINYKVELERVPGEYLGRLKVSIRTQSPVLSELFGRFFTYIARLEAMKLADFGYDNYVCEISGGSCVRYLINSKDTSDEQTGEVIGEYLIMLNKAVKLFFSAPDELPTIAAGYDAELENFLENNVI